MSTRLRALALYKELHRLGRDYPDPAYVPASSLRETQLKPKRSFRYDFHGKLRRAFESKHRPWPQLPDRASPNLARQRTAR